MVGIVHLVLDQTHAQTQELIDRPHPLAIPLGQVVIHRHDMDALPLQRIEIGRQRRHEGLPLAGGHLGDFPLVKDGPTDKLDVKVTHVEDAAGHLADGREGLVKDVVECRPARDPLLELSSPGGKGRVRKLLQVGFERIDLNHEGLESLELPLILGPDDLADHGLPEAHALSLFQRQ